MEEMDYMFKDKVMTHIKVDYINNNVEITNHTNNIILRAFGTKLKPSIEDYEEFLESRCFPKSRWNCKQLLKDLNIDYYNARLIVKKTHGVNLADYNWIRFKGEDIDYGRDIKIRE